MYVPTRSSRSSSSYDHLQRNRASSYVDDASEVVGSVHLYYRVYNQDGPIRSKQPANAANDPFVGAIDAHQVAPPHTSSSIKRHIAKVEKISDHTRTKLFLSVGSEAALEKDKHMEILDGTGPGASWEEPLAIVQET